MKRALPSKGLYPPRSFRLGGSLKNPVINGVDSFRQGSYYLDAYWQPGATFRRIRWQRQLLKQRNVAPGGVQARRPFNPYRG